jgi:hypothetical protein
MAINMTVVELSKLREKWVESRPVYTEAIERLQHRKEALGKVMSAPNQYPYKFVEEVVMAQDNVVDGESQLAQVREKLRRDFDESTGR